MRGGFRKKWLQGIRLYIVVVITNALRQAEHIAIAAESRAYTFPFTIYGLYNNRNRYTFFYSTFVMDVAIMEIPVISFIARSGTGKTTLLEKIITELKNRGYKIATIKHHSHVGFDIDIPGKDSWRFAQAGSDHVIIASPDKIASYCKLDEEMQLDEIIKPIRGVDVILVEGYKESGKPTIQVLRQETGLDILMEASALYAIVTDVPLDFLGPQFDINDVQGITEFIIEAFIKKTNQGTAIL